MNELIVNESNKYSLNHLSPILETLGMRQEDVLNKMPVHFRASCTVIHTQGQFSVANPPTGMRLKVRDNQRIKNKHAAMTNMQNYTRTVNRALNITLYWMVGENTNADYCSPSCSGTM